MVSEDQHLVQFERNLAVAQRLADSGDYDWAVTVLFYAAMHLTQVWLVRIGARAESHWQRDQEMMASPKLRPIRDSYRALRVHSENARYRCRSFSLPEFESIRGGTFTTVVTYLRTLNGGI